MTLRPVNITQSPWFYALGNTPPVCLTQNLPPELDAALLLLGCGDFRNILFTTYSQAMNSNRLLDFTCCDIEAEIMARNILAVSLIVDDVGGKNLLLIWNIYYHVFLDTDSAELLRSQARRLLASAGSLKEWSAGCYGNLLRFGDSATFEEVVELWRSYAVDPAAGREYKDIQDSIKKKWTVSKEFQKSRGSAAELSLDGIRSVAPLVSCGLQVMPSLFRTFWQSGTCSDDKKMVKKLKVGNPMFYGHRSPLTLHYATSPLRGYHLALAYAELDVGSPLGGTSTGGASWLRSASKAMKTAVNQFSQWCAAFRASLRRITIRFVACDAIAFCHVLKHHGQHGDSTTACWYRSAWGYTPLILNGPDYDEDGSAPTAYDVVDTSNLLDHVGCINLLVATAPLLKKRSTSNIRTEMLLPKEGTWAQSASKMLCGDLSTIALVLGLKPVQYWANSAASWHAAPNRVPDISSINDEESASLMARPIVLWRPFDISSFYFEACELAGLVLSLYLEMFQDENWSARFSLLYLENKGHASQKIVENEVYTRASFAMLLQYIKESNVTDWDEFMGLLIKEGVFRDQTLNMGLHHVQSLLVHLDILPLWESRKEIKWWYPHSFTGDLRGNLRGWHDIPAAVCVTLVVPHASVDMFGDIANGNGTPICQLQLHCSVASKESFYPDVQLGFGSVSAHGPPYSNDYSITIDEDKKGWQGKSPFILSAMVSTSSLVEQGDTRCNVVFALKSTPASAARFIHQLGFLLHIHESAVGNQDVFITRYRPNMNGHMAGSTANKILQSQISNSTPALSPKDVIISPIVNADTDKISCLRIRFDISSQEGKAQLQNAGVVAWETPNPYRLILTINNTPHKAVLLPVPVDHPSAKTKIARKSLWIEYTAPRADVGSLKLRTDAVFPMLPGEGLQPVLENLHYVAPDLLPVLLSRNQNPQRNFDWLGDMTSPTTTMSKEEYEEYKSMLAVKKAVLPGRLGVKGSIQSMYAHLYGLDRHRRVEVFRLGRRPTYFAILYVDSVRMDISNQTVFMDAALVSLHCGPEMEAVRRMTDARPEAWAEVRTQDQETEFWKHLLPTFAERCRYWQHKELCEYVVTERMPLWSADDKNYTCSCGLGVFPDGYLKKLKDSKLLLKHALRVAIPIISASAINMAESCPDRVAGGLQDEYVEGKGNVCFMCGATESMDGKALLRCSKCRVAQYCSGECQRQDWKAHKQMCKGLERVQDERPRDG